VPDPAGAKAASLHAPRSAKAVRHLRRVDPRLGEVIDRIGPLEQALEPDLWWALVDAICSQQLSVKASATILARVEAITGRGRPGPAELLEVPDPSLRAAGLSGAKTRYVKDLATRWLDGSLPHERIAGMPDEAVIEALTRVKGIGVWTAEMVLMFALGRPDVLPVDDLGIRVAVQRLYQLPDRPDAETLRGIGEPWRPYRTQACRYLWRSLAEK
jgi:DNA-3-methyladenine glycosylase II